MTDTKLLTILVAGLLVTAGAGTVVAADGTATATNTPTDAPDEGDETDTDDGNESDVGVDASYDDGTVDLTVTTNDTGAANVSVTANGDAVGETDANGVLAFEFDANATEKLELTLTGETFTAEYVYAIENGSLVLEESAVELDDDGEKGPSENANERAHTAWTTIQQWMSGERSGNLGTLIQEAFGHGNGSNGNADSAGQNGKADEKKPDHAKQHDEDEKERGKQKGHGKHTDDETENEDDATESDDETETDA